MRTISLRDLKLIPELSKYNEIQLIDPAMDNVMEPILAKLGFDIDYPIIYEASNHRDMQNKVAVGFRVIGELQCNRSFVNSDLCSTFERIAISSYSDRSLTRELCNLQNTSLNWDSFNKDESEPQPQEDFPDALVEENEKEVLALINQLHALRDLIRGDCHNSDGSLKTFKDYHKTEEAPKIKRKKKKDD